MKPLLYTDAGVGRTFLADMGGNMVGVTVVAAVKFAMLAEFGDYL